MEDLGDPLNDRVMKNVPQIARDPLTHEELFGNQTPNSTATGSAKVPNMDLLRKHLLREGHIDKKHLLEILSRTQTLMRK